MFYTFACFDFTHDDDAAFLKWAEKFKQIFTQISCPRAPKSLFSVVGFLASATEKNKNGEKKKMSCWFCIRKYMKSFSTTEWLHYKLSKSDFDPIFKYDKQK